jgi:hypothetical protein
MSLRAALRTWNVFFFAPQSPVPTALFRILYGIVIVANLLLLRPDWLNWYGTHGWVTLATASHVEPGIRLNLFKVMPQSDAWINAFFWVFLVFAVLLACGFMTRISSVLVFVCLTSIHQRNLFINHGGDTFLRVTGFFLMFAPAGAALSLDRLILRRIGRQGAEIKPRSPWAQRMIQFELALLYLVAFWWKSMGVTWVNGTALYYVSHLQEMQRFPVPAWLRQPVLLKLGTWFTLALEFALGVLIWFKELRYPLLAMGIIFHLCLEYSLNVPTFQWDVLTAYVLFVEPEDLARAGTWLRRRAGPRLAQVLFQPVPIQRQLHKRSNGDTGRAF